VGGAVDRSQHLARFRGDHAYERADRRGKRSRARARLRPVVNAWRGGEVEDFD